MKVSEAEAIRDGFLAGNDTKVHWKLGWDKEYLLAEILLQLQQIAIILKERR